MPVKTIILIALIIGAIALLGLLLLLLAKKKKANSNNIGNIAFEDSPKTKRNKKPAKEPKGPKGPKKGPKKGKRMEVEEPEEDLFAQFSNMEVASTEGGEDEKEDQVNIHNQYHNSRKDERALAKELLQKLFDGVSINSATKILAATTEPAVVDFVHAIYTIQSNDLKRQFSAVNIGEPVEVNRQPSGRDELITIEIPVDYKDFLLTKDGRLVGSRDKIYQKNVRVVLKKNMDRDSVVQICNINL